LKLSHATIYWVGEAIDTSIRTYANNNRYPWTPAHDRWPVIEAPTGITFVGYENPARRQHQRATRRYRP
jgi:hypothetical protein